MSVNPTPLPAMKIPGTGASGNAGWSRSSPVENQLTLFRKATLVLMAALATFLGIMPVTTLLGKPLWAYVFWLVALVVSAVHVRRFRSVSSEQPKSVDYLAAFFSSLYPAIALGVFWLLIYGFCWLLASAIQYTIGLLGSPPLPEPGCRMPPLSMSVSSPYSSSP